MPTGAPPSGEVSSRVTGVEALESFKPSAAKITVDAERINLLTQEAEKRLKAQGGREGLAAALESRPISLTKDQTEELGKQFGADFKKDDKGEYPEGTPPEAKRIATEAEQVATNLGNWQEYSLLLDEQERTGIEPPGLDAVKKKAIKTLIENSNILNINPELVMMGGALTDLIEEQLARDPKLRRKITDKLLLTQQKMDFKDIVDDPDFNAAMTHKAELTQQQEAVNAEIENALKGLGADVKPEDSALIENLVKRGQSTEVILNRLELQMLHNATRYAEVDTYNQIAAAQREAARLRAIVLAAPKGSAKIEDEQFKTTEQSIKVLEEKIADKASHEIFKKIQGALGSQKDLSGNYQNIIAQQVTELRQVNSGLGDVEKTINSKKIQAESAKNRSVEERLANEGLVLAELKNILPSAVQEILLERYDALDQADMNAQKTELDQHTQEAVSAFRQKMGETWIGIDKTKRKRQVDNVRRGNITNHIRLVAEKSATGNPEEAFQQIAIELMNFAPMIDDEHGGTRSPRIYAELNPVQKQIFDVIYKQEGQAMKEKLFRDFYAQRELMGWGQKKWEGIKESLPGVDTMGLNDQEWSDLGEKVESLLVSGSKRAKSANDILANLEANGLKVDHKDRFKLLSIIGILIGGVVLTGGVAGVAGIAGGVIRGAATTAAVGFSGL